MMRKSLLLAASLLLLAPTGRAAAPTGKPVKNVILMISDGTSLSTVSLARWMQAYMHPGQARLHLDPYLCGTVRTSCSNAPIGDSAPTTSCYVSGQPSISGFVSTYPYSCGEADLYPIDTARAYQPTLTLLEAARLERGASTGLVFTCEFPHATPADCSAHSYNRSKYEWIVPQMVHNRLDVVIGGGASLLKAEEEAYLRGEGWAVHRNDLAAMRADTASRMWSLYADYDMSYELDRDTAQQPSLAEMTTTALGKLSRNPRGFFLMVEGSKVDWAAHANDPAALYSDFLAFDKAVGAALDFARKNGETAVIVTSDHGNSGISIGRESCPDYSRISKQRLFDQLARYRLSADGFAAKLNASPRSEVQQIFQEYAGFELTDSELQALDNCADYKQSPIPADQRKPSAEASLYSNSLSGLMAQVITARTCIGFTTSGHTGEDVFLACYHPAGTRPEGMVTNVELNHYLASLFGWQPGFLSEMSDRHYAPHTRVFRGYDCTVLPAGKGEAGPTLVVKNPKKKNRTLTLPAYTNVIEVGDRKKSSRQLDTPVVYVDRNNTFYVPAALAKELE